MEMQTAWIDRGHSLELQMPDGGAESPMLVALSRNASATMAMPAATFWMALRGNIEVACREGRFLLRRGQWLSLERESRPSLYADHRGIAVGIALPANMQALSRPSAPLSMLFPGHGTARPAERSDILGLWRGNGAFARNQVLSCRVEERPMATLLRRLCGLQLEYRELVGACPGRSMRRKRQVFARMQRARLFLEGNVDRAVRVSELADLSSVSIWYFTKTFHALYGEAPQAASSRIRLGHAARMLLETGLSVSEVGAACGFENNCSFSRAFRAQLGVPPSIHRLRAGDAAGAAKAADRDRQAMKG